MGFFGNDDDAIIGEIAEFLTGERPVDVERVLACVGFTDIVDSTARAASLGDRRWCSLLDAHDRTIREQLRRFRGREINTAVIVVGYATVAAGARHGGPRRAALLLGAGAGMAFAYVAALTERTGHLLDAGVVHALET